MKVSKQEGVLGSDGDLSGSAKLEQMKNIKTVFEYLKIDMESDVKLSTFLNTVDTLENETGRNLFETEDLILLQKFSQDHPAVPLTGAEIIELLLEMSDPELENKPSFNKFASMPERPRSRRHSLLSERLRGAPLPEETQIESKLNYRRPESPSKPFLKRAPSVNSARAAIPIPNHMRPSSVMEFSSLPKGMERIASDQSLRFTNRSIMSISPTNSELSYNEIESEYALKNNGESSGTRPLSRSFSNKETKFVRRVTSELSRRLENAEGNISSITDEATKQVAALEIELKTAKADLNNKRKIIFNLRSENKEHLKTILNLEKETSEHKDNTAEYKRNYFKIKKQLEETKTSYSKTITDYQSRIDQLEIALKMAIKSETTNQDLSLKCSEMSKTISILERDVKIAQTVAKNYDEILQENFQLKETVESLHKTVSELQPVATTTANSSATLNEARTNVTLISELATLDKINPDNKSTPPFPLPNSYPTASWNSANTRELREFEKENRYLKRHLDRVWDQWDKAKNEIQAAIQAGDLSNDSAMRKLGLLIAKMEKNRPKQSFPNFQRASIQPVLIDDRPIPASSPIVLTAATPPQSNSRKPSSNLTPSKPSSSKNRIDSAAPEAFSEEVSNKLDALSNSKKPPPPNNSGLNVSIEPNSLAFLFKTMNEKTSNTLVTHTPITTIPQADMDNEMHSEGLTVSDYAPSDNSSSTHDELNPKDLPTTIHPDNRIPTLLPHLQGLGGSLSSPSGTLKPRRPVRRLRNPSEGGPRIVKKVSHSDLDAEPTHPNSSDLNETVLPRDLLGLNEAAQSENLVEIKQVGSMPSVLSTSAKLRRRPGLKPSISNHIPHPKSEQGADQAIGERIDNPMDHYFRLFLYALAAYFFTWWTNFGVDYDFSKSNPTENNVDADKDEPQGNVDDGFEAFDTSKTLHFGSTLSSHKPTPTNRLKTG